MSDWIILTNISIGVVCIVVPNVLYLLEWYAFTRKAKEEDMRKALESFINFPVTGFPASAYLGNNRRMIALRESAEEGRE